VLPAHNSVRLKPVIILSYYELFTGVKEFYYTEYAFRNAVKFIDFAWCFLPCCEMSHNPFKRSRCYNLCSARFGTESCIFSPHSV